VPKHKQPTGYVIYRGPSQLDGQPIVVVALVSKSTNGKTGNMVQTYILRDGVNPVEAARTGQDESVCGDCKHRPANAGGCYVTLIHGPSVVWRQLQAGAYPVATEAELAALGAGRMVRLGTYGDPAAAPARIWAELVRLAAGRTGYTHQWRNESLPMGERLALRALVMASADDAAEAQQARELGMRHFRIRTADEALLPREIICPASEEAGKRKTCETCGACSGTQRAGQASVVIIVHGTKAGRYIAQRQGVAA
jgi:hypothetical protein